MATTQVRPSTAVTGAMSSTVGFACGVHPDMPELATTNRQPRDDRGTTTALRRPIGSDSADHRLTNASAGAALARPRRDLARRNVKIFAAASRGCPTLGDVIRGDFTALSADHTTRLLVAPTGSLPRRLDISGNGRRARIQEGSRVALWFEASPALLARSTLFVVESVAAARAPAAVVAPGPNGSFPSSRVVSDTDDPEDHHRAPSGQLPVSIR